MAETIFHKIMKREIPAKIEFEDEHCIAIRDIHPAAPTHILVIPKKTLESVEAADESDEALLGHLMIVGQKLARKEGLAKSGYRLVLNCGEGAGQSVFQLHLHLLGGRGFSWPPG